MRILVIEDDEDLADALVRRLRRLGHAVDCQNDGLSADGVLQYETFDLVILDIGLPRMSGFDILHRLNDRFPRRVLLWPVAVQGEGAAEQIAAAIAGFNMLAPGGKVPRPDVLIVARGGGSLEDLMAFNEEIVVRAAAASDIPLISAVGHETDTTLIDFAASVRAPTPTAAGSTRAPATTSAAPSPTSSTRSTSTPPSTASSWSAATTARSPPSPTCSSG